MDIVKWSQLRVKIEKGIAQICAIPIPKRKKKEKSVEWNTETADQIIKRIFLKNGIPKDGGVYINTGWRGLFWRLPKKWNAFIAQHKKQLIDYMIYEWSPKGLTKVIDEDYENNYWIEVRPL